MISSYSKCADRLVDGVAVISIDKKTLSERFSVRHVTHYQDNAVLLHWAKVLVRVFPHGSIARYEFGIDENVFAVRNDKLFVRFAISNLGDIREQSQPPILRNHAHLSLLLSRL